jgi:hypothetical protein
MARLQAWSRLIFSGISLCAMAAAFPCPAHAWAQVEGQMHFLTVRARDASVADVLATLAARLGVRIEASSPCPGEARTGASNESCAQPQSDRMRSEGLDQAVSGTFQGPLQRVIGRLFAGHDYVVKYSRDAVEIIVLNASSSAQSVSAADEPSLASQSERQLRRSRKRAAPAAEP